jgi:hypothetical protein
MTRSLDIHDTLQGITTENSVSSEWRYLHDMSVVTTASHYISPSMHSRSDENSRIYSRAYAEARQKKSRDNASNSGPMVV